MTSQALTDAAGPLQVIYAGKARPHDESGKTVIARIQHRDGSIDVMRHAIALSGSFFNSHRMVEEYVLNACAV